MMAANGMIRQAYPSDILPIHENLFGNTHVSFRHIMADSIDVQFMTTPTEK
jgi:hypothetical protein